MATAPSPPSYDETVGQNYGAPPSYNDLFPVNELKSEVYQAREEGLSPSVPVKICSIFFKSIACGICYIIIALLPLSMIIIGSVYFHKCDIQPKVPLFLVVFGCVGLLQTAMHILQMVFCREKDEENNRNRDAKEKGGNCCESFLTLFLFIWIIIGSYYTFSAFRSWNEHGQISCSSGSDSHYCCDHPVIIYAFSVLILIYAVGAFCCCCICCCVGCISGIINATK